MLPKDSSSVARSFGLPESPVSSKGQGVLALFHQEEYLSFLKYLLCAGVVLDPLFFTSVNPHNNPAKVEWIVSIFK